MTSAPYPEKVTTISGGNQMKNHSNDLLRFQLFALFALVNFSYAESLKARIRMQSQESSIDESSDNDDNSSRVSKKILKKI